MSMSESEAERRAARRPIDLCPSTDSERTSAVSLVTHLLDAAQSKIDHIDQLRQKNLSNALLLFGGLFGFSTALPHGVRASAVLAVLAILMALLTRYDRKLHVVSHGWRHTRDVLIQRCNELFNIRFPLPSGTDPKCVTVCAYYKKGEHGAELISAVPLLFYALVIGAAVLSGLAYTQLFQFSVTK